MDPVIDPRRCPLCGGPNACGRSEGRSTCWCFEVPIARDVLARIPPEAERQACICQRCATGDGPQADPTARSAVSPARSEPQASEEKKGDLARRRFRPRARKPHRPT
jgi:hypothetical protein